ncbi:MAG: hypothetical protein CEE43_18695 [Promethearchaeota archaeon Loki_b32]|nr:MAG: hypothetical protein CEE43_18695 [Candidatus Lokiarchaeota archaeon Loki_b32]
MSENNLNPWIKKILILAIFIGVIILTAEVDWAAENSEVGLAIRLVWLISLLSLGLILPIGFMYLAGNIESERGKSDKKWLMIGVILFLIANGIPIVFYLILEISPGFFLYVQLVLFGLIPAFFLQPKKFNHRILILVILFAVIIAPIGFLVNSTIDDLWYAGVTDKTMYYLSFWGLLMTFFYLILAIGWKLGGGSKRQSWNIFVAGTLLQYSTLEDFFYFFLNGQPLPGTWPWMSNFVINLEALFGHVITDLDLLIFCLIISSIAIFILFDGHGYIWKKLKS